MNATFISRHRVYWLCVGWIAFVFLALHLFKVLDYDAGRERFLVLMAIPAAAYVFRRWARVGDRDPGVDREWAKETRLVLIVGAVALAVLAVRNFSQARIDNEVPSDQAQGTSRAIELMTRFHANPYGPTTMLQPADLGYDLEEFELKGCGSGEDTRAWLKDAWNQRGEALLAPVLPSSPGSGPCEAIARRLHTMGYRYGPVMLAFYAPFVVSMWEAGVLVAHGLLVIVGLTALVIAVKRKTGSDFAAAAVGAMMVWSDPMRWEIFTQGHSDLLPTALALAFYFFRRDDRPMIAAVMIGLSVGAKPLPGLLWLPLLARQPRALLLAGAVAIAGYAPFAWWNAGGLWSNISYPFLNRYTDSTALAHYLLPGARKVLSLMAVGSCGVFGWRWLQSNSASDELDYLLVAHAAVLASGTVFHNNYLVWLMPVLALVLIEPFRENPVAPVSARPSPAI